MTELGIFQFLMNFEKLTIKMVSTSVIKKVKTPAAVNKNV